MFVVNEKSENRESGKFLLNNLNIYPGDMERADDEPDSKENAKLLPAYIVDN